MSITDGVVEPEACLDQELSKSFRTKSHSIMNVVKNSLLARPSSRQIKFKERNQMSNSFEKEWTVMVYMSGNNNLSEEMISELKGMQAAMKSKSASKEINLVAIYHSSYFSVEPAVYGFTSENAASRLQDCKLEVEPGDLGTDRRLPGIDDFVRLVVEKAGLRAK